MPIFRKQEESDVNGYRKVGIPANQVTDGELTRIKVGGESVLITRWQEQLYAFSSICPHAAADLSKGRFARNQIKCPDHSYTFDIRTGRVVWPEDEVCRLKRFALKELDGNIWIQI